MEHLSMIICSRFLAAHLVGRRLIYPGSLAILNVVLCKYIT